jgi:hypothetical protein
MTPDRRPKRLALVVAAVLPLAAGVAGARADTILFVGNSFTYGANSPVWRYRASTVHDLNDEGVGGVPALFKRFTEEAGLDWQVSLETHPGAGLDWHWANGLSKIDRPWDHVVLQSYSTLDAQRPGDPAKLIDDVGRFAERLHARNPKVDIRLNATWSRPDLTYAAPSPWHGKSIFAMADDLACAYGRAAHGSPYVAGVVETGEAFNRAIRTGVADPNPYDGTAFGQVDLWSYDHYHASTYGYYLEALMIFGAVTGRDPLSLGPRETAGEELGLSQQQTVALQQVAHDQLAAGDAASRACP